MQDHYSVNSQQLRQPTLLQLCRIRFRGHMNLKRTAIDITMEMNEFQTSDKVVPLSTTIHKEFCQKHHKKLSGVLRNAINEPPCGHVCSRVPGPEQ